MLQTGSATTKALINSAAVGKVVATTDKQADIVKRLEELNKWQEEQKLLLEARQTKQRQMLGLEQQSMYQMLGIQSQSDMSLLEDLRRGAQMQPVVSNETIEYEEEERSTEESLSNSQLEEEDDLEKDDYQADREPSSYKTLTSGYETEHCSEVPKNIPKKTFLKRGEGLKQRFKIDPEELRLNNLPKYKFANAHSKSRLTTSKKFNNNPVKPESSKNVNLKNSAVNSLKNLNILDAQEQRFQNLLITSKNICSSTPDTKNLNKIKSESDLAFSRSKKNSETQAFEAPPRSPRMIAWSKILDPQEIQPLQVPRNCLQTAELPQSEESIFELLEQKAKDGSFDMDSTCLKKFMQRRITEKLNGTDDCIPVKDELRNKRFEPFVSKNIEQDSVDCSEADEEESSQDSQQIYSTQSEETTHKTIETTNSSEQNQQTPQARVRFSDSNETHEYEEDCQTTMNDSTRLSAGTVDDEGQGDTTNNELFIQFKQALFAALQVKADQHLANDTTTTTVTSISDTTLTPLDNNNSIYTPTCQDLQEKTDMIKVRLAELEKEIQNFKENNVLLMKAKQKHELEKSLHAQEHLEAMERLKDEKIKMEIYLHDERLKLEDEKRQFELNIKSKNQGLLGKERKECERLREQVANLEAQLKTKECNHTSAQGRLRSQIRSLEKEQNKLHEQIEALTKENKRLENENLRISREQNNKILLEINRNIAKLAPKIQHTSTSIPNEGPPVLGASKTMSKCIVATATSNKNSAKPSKATVAKFTNKSQTAISNSSSPEPDVMLKETNLQNQQQQQLKYSMLDPDQDDDDILKEFQMTPVKRNNMPTMTQGCSNNKSPQKSSPQQQNKKPITAPPSSPRLSDNTNNMKREIVNADGGKDIWYPNGNLKKISPDGMIIRMLYYNKDIKETNINEGTVKYYYAETNTWHTTYLDGLEILEFPNGQVEHRHKNGVVEVHYPNNSIKIIDPKDEHKQEEWRFADGTHLVQMRNGDKILSLPNGQKEIHNKLHKRREYPDGTVKIVYPDGSTETRYSTGRVRLKDKDGKLVMDTDMAK